MADNQPEKNYFVHPTAEVAADAIIGAGTKIWHQCQIMPGARIGERCNLGKSVYVDTGVQIGNRVKIQNGISVYKGVVIEDDVLLGPHMVFTNDLYPRAFNNNYEILPTLVKQGASVGANATIVCGTTIGNYSMVGAGAVVTSDVPDYALVIGNPARLIGYVCSCAQRLTLDSKSRRGGQVTCSRCGKQFRIETSLLSVI